MKKLHVLYYTADTADCWLMKSLLQFKKDDDHKQVQMK